MKRLAGSLCFLLCILCSLCGCAVGDKAASLSTIYFAAGFLSLILLLSYLWLVRQKDRWMIVLFLSICIVNIGYSWLAVAPTLSAALNANRLAYLGSVFLPMSMLMVILHVSKLTIHRTVPWILSALSIVVFFITATPGILPWYYREVSLEIVNGVTTLHKVYGPLHGLYLVYLLGYFAAMVTAILQAIRRKALESLVHLVFLAVAAFVNIGVWLIEQLVAIDFEMLSVSYIISELFLLALCLMLQEIDKRLQQVNASAVVPPPSGHEACYTDEQFAVFCEGLSHLTATERTVYELYVQGKSSKEILTLLNIKENTLKYHNRNIYSKLGVSSRKLMLAMAANYTQS